MSSTNKTTHYELPQFVENDIFNPLVDDNDAYAKIDTALYNIADAEADDAAEIVTAKGRLDTVEGKVDALETQNGTDVLTTVAQTLSGAVNELKSGEDSLDGRLDVVEDDINNASTGLKTKVSALETQNGSETLETTAQTLSGAINEVNGVATTNKDDIEMLNEHIHPTKFKTIAHRGYPLSDNIYAQDNSQAAFALAGLYGFNAIECDPRKDVNGHIVMLHDATVDSVAVESGNIVDLDYNDVHYKTKNGRATTRTLSTIEDTIAIAKMYDMYIFFDMGKQTCTVSEIIDACEALDFYNIAFFDLADDAEFIDVPDYVIKICGGISFSHTENEIRNLVTMLGTNNVGVRINTSTPSIDATVEMIKSYGLLIMAGDANSMFSYNDYVVSQLDYVFCESNNIYVSGGKNEISNYAHTVGAHNLYKCTRKDTISVNGTLITFNADGSFVINGQYAGTSNYIQTIGYAYLKAGTYYFSGKTSDEHPKYSLILAKGNTGVSEIGGGSITKVVVNEDAIYNVKLKMQAGADAVTDLIYKPVITSIWDDKYIPTSLSSEYLINVLNVIANKMNVKNLFKTTASLPITSRGVTISDNGDGSLHISGHDTGTGGGFVNLGDVDVPAGLYLLTGDDTGARVAGVDLQLMDVNNTSHISESYGSGILFKVDTPTTLRVRLHFAGSYSGDADDNIYPMLRAFGIMDDSFVKKVSTNAELEAAITALEARVAALEQ